MYIDLVAAEAAVEAVKAELGLPHRSSCIEVLLWHFGSGTREFSVQLTMFDRSDRCLQASAATWQEALEKLRVKLTARSVDPGQEPIEVLAPAES